MCLWTGEGHSLILMKQPKKASQCLRSFTRQCKPLTRGWVDWVCFRGETPRESDWGCQSIPWLLYMYYHKVCTCLYQIYQYSLGQAWWGLKAWCNHMAVAQWKKKHKHGECTCVWQHSHAQHGNELSRIKLGLIEQGSPWGKHMFAKWWRVWDK